MSKVLVIAPHPDDEVLGCGGTILEHVNTGDHVSLCIVTEGYTPDWSEELLERKEEEIEEATNLLGIEDVYQLGLQTAKLDQVMQKELNDRLSKIMTEVDPDILYIPSKSDLHKDHRIIFESVLVASRPHQADIERILAYETLSETEWGQPIQNFEPNWYVDITGNLEKKLEAMKAYQDELKDSPHPRSIEGIKAKVKQRGSEIAVENAEAFRLIRAIQ